MPDPRIRAISRDDVPAVVGLIYELAEYERLVELCHITDDQLTAALFGPSPALFGLVATDEDVVVGYALYFLNFSTWEGVHGIYLEDLYVRPDQRGSGLGRALLAGLAERRQRAGLRPGGVVGAGLERPVDRVLPVPGCGTDGRLDCLPAHRSGAAPG